MKNNSFHECKAHKRKKDILRGRYIVPSKHTLWCQINGVGDQITGKGSKFS